jgi:hypothetical protein
MAIGEIGFEIPEEVTGGETHSDGDNDQKHADQSRVHALGAI